MLVVVPQGESEVKGDPQTPEKILAPKTIGAADLQRCAEVGAALEIVGLDGVE